MCQQPLIDRLIAQADALVRARLTLGPLADPLAAQADLDPLVDRLEGLAEATLYGDVRVHINVHQAHHDAQEAMVLLQGGGDVQVALALLRVASHRLTQAVTAAQRTRWDAARSA